MNKTKNVMMSNAILQVFLSICSGHNKERQIKENINVSQPVIRQYIDQLRCIGLIIKGRCGEQPHYPGYKRFQYFPNYVNFLLLNPFHIDGIKVPQCMVKPLQPLCKRFLFRMAQWPKWRTVKWVGFNVFEDKSSKKVVVKDRLHTTFYNRESQENTINRSLGIEELSKTFLEYLIINQNIFSRKLQKCIKEYIRLTYQSIEGGIYLSENIPCKGLSKLEF